MYVSRTTLVRCNLNSNPYNFHYYYKVNVKYISQTLRLLLVYMYKIKFVAFNCQFSYEREGKKVKYPGIEV